MVHVVSIECRLINHHIINKDTHYRMSPGSVKQLSYLGVGLPSLQYRIPWYLYNRLSLLGLELSILLLRRLLRRARQRHSQLQVWRVEIQGLQLSKAASLMQSSLATDGRVSQSQEAAQLVDQ